VFLHEVRLRVTNNIGKKRIVNVFIAIGIGLLIRC
jgi:hypothetical protein